MNGNGEMALIGYAMGAELGYESAQSSAAYLLYPRVSFLEEKPYIPVNRFKSALNYYLRSANQNNLDSAVFLGDMHYYGLKRRLPNNYSSAALPSSDASKVSIDEDKVKVSTNDTYLIPVDYSKAANLYHKAANELSSQARFNLGYMYELGLGVPKDLHLAKRYYDLALTSKKEAYIPIQLSLFRLQLKFFWYRILGLEVGEVSSSKRTWRDWLNLYQTLRIKGRDLLNEDFIKMSNEMQQQQGGIGGEQMAGEEGGQQQQQQQQNNFQKKRSP
ncbi:unnamed protein product [[Candida] boidinii]|nr:unnamed protein product [[Candida] boidinii]